LFPGAKLSSIKPVPCSVEDANRILKLTIVTNVSTAVVTVEAVGNEVPADFQYSGSPLPWNMPVKESYVVALNGAVAKALKMPYSPGKYRFSNNDESKNKRGSNMNMNFEGGYNVSYFTPRVYNEMFSDLTGDQIVFFGLQYFLKEYCTGKIITPTKIDEADAFIGRYMADARIGGDNFEDGYDYTMFPRGDWEAMATGDYDETGRGNPQKAGMLPIRVEALPEGTLQEPGVCSFKITNTHPRFFWLPNFLETLLVQVWYPISVATQAREFKKTIQAYSVLSQRTSQFPAEMGPPEFTEANIADDQLAIHIAQVFDLLDFGYRGVSSHETASLGSAAYYTTGFEGSDTVAGSRMLLQYYNATDKSLPPIIASFKGTFEQGHGATSLPAAEHSTITSWADVSPDADYVEYECAEYAAFTNMIKQYMPSFCVSLVSDGFNIWNAVTNLWPSDAEMNGCPSMRAMLAERLANGQATILRPDSGEGVETLPQLLTVLSYVLPEHWETELAELVSIFPPGDSHEGKYFNVIQKIMAKLGMSGGNPFRRMKGQQMRVLQGDGVALDSVCDMCASILANGFCINTVNFGSGGGLLQKLNRDSLGVAFKCCAMYVGGNTYPVGKDPIAGGKKSYGGNPAVLRGEDGVLRNRGMYEQNADGSFGAMVEAIPMTYDEFLHGVEGDELQEVFKDGVITKEQNFTEIKHRAKIVNLDAAIRKAVDNLDLKCDFMQKMTSDEAIAIRLAEASVGSKWSHTHPTRLGDLQQNLPQFAPAFAKLGLVPEMSSTDVVNHIKDNHVCDRSAKKTIFRALADDEPEKAIKAMGSKAVITL
jgi:nicotinamide phosphoribosyltransferase